uniref:Glycoside hydrolase family 5 domain-containing protein n=1 Tax=Acrobeloides nanus TaxID=290746 RepID=A0A914D8S5_9BILA
MSFFPSDYIGDEVADYFNEAAVHQIKCAWNANVVRAPTMPKEDKVGGWMTDKDRDYSRLKKVVDAAIKEGIYVIVDWHAFNDPHIDGAKDFFANISKTYGSFPNIIYEIWNEPDGENGTWPLVKEYAEEIIDTIRQNDPNNIIIVGTPNWSQRVDQAAQDPINLTNIAYTLHYYAASHGQPIRDIALSAINQGLPIFITEYGTVTYTGAGPMNESEANLCPMPIAVYKTLQLTNLVILHFGPHPGNWLIKNLGAPIKELTATIMVRIKSIF